MAGRPKHRPKCPKCRAEALPMYTQMRNEKGVVEYRRVKDIWVCLSCEMVIKEMERERGNDGRKDDTEL